MIRISGLRIGKCFVAAVAIFFGVIVVVWPVLYYQLNYGSAIAVTPVAGFPLTLTGRNFDLLHSAARYVVLQHEFLHQRGERSEPACYQKQLALASCILSAGSFDGRSLTHVDAAELHFLSRLAQFNLESSHN
jgi:hypothetical protein